METNEMIIQLVSLSVSLLISLMGLFTAFIKAIKNKKWDSLKAALCGFIADAEKLIDKTGSEKKDVVLRWAEEFCEEQGIKFDSDRVSSMIETLIDLTKKVNVNDNSSETKSDTNK